MRCAIYTRKSHSEGLEQPFNSLDAQRQACSYYVASQASEGWDELRDRYDDGGFSGGTLERPALQRLLADVAAGSVDIIVVYKIDRLSRSLRDFVRLVALEFELAADILRTAVAPTWTEIGQLAAIAVLRTALNYFLQAEIDKAEARRAVPAHIEAS